MDLIAINVAQGLTALSARVKESHPGKPEFAKSKPELAMRQL
jgi:hypothetical protein